MMMADHQEMHGQPAQFHIVAGDLRLATLSGFRDENEASLWAKQHYAGIADCHRGSHASRHTKPAPHRTSTMIGEQ